MQPYLTTAQSINLTYIYKSVDQPELNTSWMLLL